MKPPPFSGVVALVVLGLVFHFVYLLSIFDIYFRSPIVHGMPPYSIPLTPPANRLVLFVADGLRADTFYETIPGTTESAPITRAPFLRSIIEKNGTWGVSHTRVPTETRPGHVALIAGLYEDVSAVTKGWKHNPVEFDSVFNRSSFSFGYGSPDVLPMFVNGQEHIFFETYDSDAENFGNDASQLDEWVFDKIHTLLDNMKRDSELKKKLDGPGAVLFLHLLAMDTYGHAYRPYSSEYKDHIYRVDQGIQKVYEAIESLFPDKKTSYVFTSDHGMSNKGNHGDGEKANTETPLVCWGAGIDTPRTIVKRNTDESGEIQERDESYDEDRDKRIRSHNEKTPAGWMLDHLLRRDVNQADITPLMALLIGLPAPVNSVGVLPLSHLPPNSLYPSTALLYNAKQVLAQYLFKANARKEATIKILYQPFHLLDHHADLVQQIDSLIQSGDLEKANNASLELIDLALQGLHYYQVYDWPFIMTVVACGYLGWIVTVLIFTINNYADTRTSARRSQGTQERNDASAHARNDAILRPSRALLVRIFVPLSLGFTFLYLQRSPLMYYLYLLFPVMFWAWALGYIAPTLRHMSHALGTPKKATAKPVPSSSFGASLPFTTIFSFLIMQCAVVGYFYREVYFIALFGVAVWTWSGMTAPLSASRVSIFGIYVSHSYLQILWWVACILVGVFPLVPLDFGESVPLVMLGALFLIIAGALLLIYPIRGSSSSSFRNNSILVSLTILSCILVLSSTHSLSLKQGLPPLNQFLSWGVLFTSLTFVFFYPRKHSTVQEGLANVYLSVAPSFVLLSIAYEVLFYAALALQLLAWVLVELQFFAPKVKNDKESSGITTHDVRRAVIYIIMCYVSMFGTGNIASISSFEISSTYRFVTIFSPFVMTSLLVWKLAAPIVVVSCVFFGLTRFLQVPRPAVFLLVVGLADFFFLVRDEGSWQEIGVSIGHFAICNTFIILQLFLFSLSSIVIRLPSN